MDFQRLQFAAYLRDAALKRIAENTKNAPPAAAAEYLKENLILIATEIFEEVDDIAGSVEANASDRRSREWAGSID